MKNTIDQLVKVANEFADFGRKIHESRDSHNEISEGVYLYFGSSYDTASVRFRNKIEVSLYANKIEMPFNTTEDVLQKTFDHAEGVLFSWKQRCDPKIEKQRNKEKEIQTLKERLQELEKA